MPAKSPMTDDLKLCRPCATWKMHNMFAKDARIKSGLSARCKECNKAGTRKHREANPGENARYVAEWRKLNPEYTRSYYDANITRLREAGSAANKFRKYGITAEQYAEMLEAQKGVCGICSKPETAKWNDGRVKNLAIDHCHTSGIVRKLLCQHCNTGLGSFKDNIQLLGEAINYLKEFK